VASLKKATLLLEHLIDYLDGRLKDKPTKEEINAIITLLRDNKIMVEPEAVAPTGILRELPFTQKKDAV
jgi:hypothetical protein